MDNFNFWSYLGTIGGARTVALVLVVIAGALAISKVSDSTFFGVVTKVARAVVGLIGKVISRKEKRYHRDIEIGKLSEKRRKVKIYKFLNDLTIDIGLKQKGATPYEFLFVVVVGAVIGTVLMCYLMFGSLLMIIPMFPIVFAAIMCTIYTRANIAHDSRIEAVIEAENVICNNIREGVMVSIKSTKDVMPRQVRGNFQAFINNVEDKNYHIKTALLELNSELGSVADEFIKKCIVFELEEEHGIVGIFRDVVELNNIKMKLRNEMKRQFEAVVQQFKIAAAMIFVFLAGLLVVYPDIRKFYFENSIGQIIIAADLLILIGQYVYVTYLRAQEL